jgi:ABC-2 type transport system permease protein
MSVTVQMSGGPRHRSVSRSPGQSALIRSEFTRLLATRSWLILGSVTIFLAAVGTISTGVALNRPHGLDASTTDGMAKALSSGFTAGLVASIFAALMVTSEFRHRTVGQSVLDSGTRIAWVIAKIPAAVVSGLLLTVLGQLVTLAIGVPFLTHAGAHPDLWHGQLLRMIIGTALLGIPAALWGTALGLLIRSQVGTIIGLAIYSVVAEAAVLQFIPALGRWLPGGGQGAIVDDPTLPYHNTLLGIAVYGMWIVIIGFLGINRFVRSDIST